MKYWLFERGDVVGPFPAEELTGREGFGPQSLVCPEDRGDDDTFWKEAQFYEDFAPAASPAPAEPDEKQASAVPEPVQPAEKKDVFDEELDSLLSENNPLAEAEPSAGETAEKVHFPPHEPAKSGPIEDYFNNIQGGDLGNILGIPDPNENSDMNLARAFEKQFKQTEPPVQAQTPVQIESGPFDEFTAKEDLDDLTPGDGLAAVAPLNDNGAPVVLAEKPLPAEEKPKFRLRKKQEPKPGEDKTALRAETQPAQEKPAAGEHLQPAQAEPTPAAVPDEKQTPAEQEPAGQIPADKKSAPEKASAEEPQPQAQKEETLTEEKQPAETQAPAEKAEEISPAGAADGETVLPEETQPQTQGAVSPAEQAEPAPTPQTETTGAVDSAPLQAAQEVQPEPAPQAEPEREERDSIRFRAASGAGNGRNGFYPLVRGPGAAGSFCKKPGRIKRNARGGSPCSGQRPGRNGGAGGANPLPARKTDFGYTRNGGGANFPNRASAGGERAPICPRGGKRNFPSRASASRKRAASHANAGRNPTARAGKRKSPSRASSGRGANACACRARPGGRNYVRRGGGKYRARSAGADKASGPGGGAASQPGETQT